MIKFLKNPIVPYIIAIVAIFLLFRQCNKTSELKEIRENEQEFLSDSISYYKNELGQEIAQKTALQGDKTSLELLLTKKRDSLGQLKNLLEDFKNIDAAGNITTITKIDTVFIPYEVPVEIEFMRKWSKKDKYYSISGISTNEGITINDLAIPNQLSFAIGHKKTGWLSSEYRIEAVNSNPYVSTVGLDAYTLKTSKGVISLDAQLGYGITVYGDTPYAGIGLGLDLWQLIKSLFQ